jgi:peptidyl-prolyl cis-trans isomerase C
MRCRSFLISVLLASLIGCAPKPTTQSQQAVVMAKVGTQPISAALFDYYVEKSTGQAPDNVDAGLKKRLLDDLIGIEATAAAGAPLVKPADEQAIELARLEILSKVAENAAGVYAAPSDPELQTAYQSYVSSLPASEYHVAHILVATEALAIRAVLDLDHGTDFATLAKERSADDSKARGGDLGWISPGHLPKNFTDAMSNLKPGQYTKLPIKTPYGWHVIKLIETRPADAPPFDQVKAQLAVNLQQERRAKFIQTVLAKTTIERMTPETSGK